MEATGALTFRGPLGPPVKARMFGGQILGQSLAAAAATVPDDRAPHSMHHYFLRPADGAAAVDYQVDVTRDGNLFTRRAVRAYQHGKLLGASTIAFHHPEQGSEFQANSEPPHRPPEAPMLLPYPAPGVHTDGFDLRWVTSPVNTRTFWLRPTIDLPDNPLLHACVLVYFSDLWLVDVVLQSRGQRFDDHTIVASTLDHAMWFHRPAHLIGWTSLTSHSPVSTAGHGLAITEIHAHDGNYLATAAQEAFIRPRRTATPHNTTARARSAR